MSSFGKAFRVTVFGSSHGPETGVTIEGLPAGFRPDLEALQRFLERRAPGRSELGTGRFEPDRAEFTAGMTDGVCSGSAVTAVIRNTDARPGDYKNIRTVPRPGHADYPAMVKYGNEYGTGGGQFSGRMTAPLCVAGGLALQLLAQQGITVTARPVRIGGTGDETEFTAKISEAKKANDSVGGVVECEIRGLPVGLGGPMWDGLESGISAAVYGIPAVKGVEFGAGFCSAEMRGSENNDQYCLENGQVKACTNHAGGILGGMADGMPLVFRTAFKPAPSIGTAQRSVDLKEMRETDLTVGGRHDPCVVPRAVPCVEAAAACSVLDAIMLEDHGGDLTALRREIDRADRDLIRAFDRRMDIARRIGLWKKANGAAVLDSGRERAKLDAVAEISSNPAAVRELYETLMRLSREEQKKL